MIYFEILIQDVQHAKNYILLLFILFKHNKKHLDVNLKVYNWVLVVLKSNQVRESNPDAHCLKNLLPVAISGNNY